MDENRPGLPPATPRPFSARWKDAILMPALIEDLA